VNSFFEFILDIIRIETTSRVARKSAEGMQAEVERKKAERALSNKEGASEETGNNPSSDSKDPMRAAREP
jgi:hypothetical protein